MHPGQRSSSHRRVRHHFPHFSQLLRRSDHDEDAERVPRREGGRTGDGDRGWNGASLAGERLQFSRPLEEHAD